VLCCITYSPVNKVRSIFRITWGVPKLSSTPCLRCLPDCDLNHVYRWFMLFILLYNLSKLLPNSINYLIGGDKA